MKCTDQIFSMPRIDSGLAADRRIDLREKRRRDLYKVKATTHARSGKPGKITYHTSAKREDQIIPFEASGYHCLADLFEGRVVF